MKVITVLYSEKSNSDTEKSLSLTYYISESKEIKQLKIRKINENTWYTLWENDDGEVEDIFENDIEKVIKKIMFDNDFIGIN